MGAGLSEDEIEQEPLTILSSSLRRNFSTAQWAGTGFIEIVIEGTDLLGAHLKMPDKRSLPAEAHTVITVRVYLEPHFHRQSPTINFRSAFDLVYNAVHCVFGH